MKKNVRILLALMALALCVLCVLCACGKKNKNGDAALPEQNAGQTNGGSQSGGGQGGGQGGTGQGGGGSQGGGHEHAFTQQSTDTAYLASAASCQSPATYYYSCACGEKTTTTFIDGAKGDHVKKDGICTLCGEGASDGLVFKNNTDGSCTLNGLGTCTAANIVIPPVSPEGKVVTAISAEAFKTNSTNVVSVTIPASVTKIDATAFNYGKKLTTFIVDPANEKYTAIDGVLYSKDGKTLIKYPIGRDATSFSVPQGVTALSSYAFSHSGLTTVTLPDSLTKLGSSVFQYCSNLANVTLPAGVTEIPDHAFENCAALMSFEIPSTVTAIAAEAFAFCPCTEKVNDVVYLGAWAVSVARNAENVTLREGTVGIADSIFSGINVESIAFPSTLRYIPVSSFSTSEELYTISMSSSNPYYKVVDNVLYSKDGTILMLFPAAYDIIDYLVIPDGVTTIDNHAFADNAHVGSILIPASVTTIRDSAFASSKELAVITFAEGSQLESIGEYAFYYCAKLTDIVIPEGVTEIKGYTFYLCRGLESVTLPSTLTSIGNGAFETCNNLATINLPEGLTSIGVSALEATALTNVAIPATLTEIGKYAFSECKALTAFTVAAGNTAFKAVDNVLFSLDGKTLIAYPARKADTSYTVPAGVTHIGLSAFDYTQFLTTVTIPASVTEIDTYAFEYGEALTTVIFAEGSQLVTIGSYAFDSCEKLASITIPSGVTEIGAGAFRYCSALTTINIPAGVTKLNSYTFFTCSNLETVTFAEGSALESIDTSAFTACQKLASITIPAGVTEIGTHAFSYTAITSVTIPQGLTKLPSNAFYRCEKLESVTFAAGSQLESIGDSAFYYCEKLASITIPASVTSIGKNAFHYCAKLESVTFAQGSKLESIGDSAFCACQKLASITIPSGVTEIAARAFGSCVLLTNITLPSTLTYIGAEMFSNCHNLTEITFNGTTAQWAAIRRGNNWNGYNSGLQIHCSDGDVAV